MNVFVETNFVLEIALLQDEHEWCGRIIDLARDGTIQLLIPAYCLAEPNDTLIRRHRERSRLKREFDLTLAQLSRSRAYAARLAGYQELTALLIDATQEEAQRLQAVRESLLASSTIIGLDAEVLASGASLQVLHDLGAQDAIVLASVLAQLRRSAQTTGCFVTRNTKDFDDPDIVDALSVQNCRLFSRFEACFQYASRAAS